MCVCFNRILLDAFVSHEKEVLKRKPESQKLSLREKISHPQHIQHMHIPPQHTIPTHTIYPVTPQQNSLPPHWHECQWQQIRRCSLKYLAFPPKWWSEDLLRHWATYGDKSVRCFKTVPSISHIYYIWNSPSNEARVYKSKCNLKLTYVKMLPENKKHRLQRALNTMLPLLPPRHEISSCMPTNSPLLHSLCY